MAAQQVEDPQSVQVIVRFPGSADLDGAQVSLLRFLHTMQLFQNPAKIAVGPGKIRGDGDSLTQAVFSFGKPVGGKQGHG